MANIEFVHGQESHSSNWGKFYVKGLEKYQVKEDFSEERNDNHHTYNGYDCQNIPEGKIFTIFEQSGDKRGTNTFYFAICTATDETVEGWEAGYGSGFCRGNFKIIARGEGKVKAPRLMNWWVELPSSKQNLEMAYHCAAYIEKRGLKDLPPLDKKVDSKQDQIQKIEQRLAQIEAERLELQARLQELQA